MTIRFNRLAGVAVLSGAFLLANQVPGVASAATPRTLIIGVDHVDPANQDPTHNRVFEYTDFFSRHVQIHRGDTLDFRTAPGAFHIVAVTRDEPAIQPGKPTQVPVSDSF